jgi:iron complex outermembrane receptor protein
MGILALLSQCLYAQNKISGRITDKESGESLPGVSVYLPDLKTGAISDAGGNYEIKNLPHTRVMMQVSYIGYKLLAEVVDLSVTSSKDFALEITAAELNEVVVTGMSEAGEKNRTPTPITIVTSITLLQNPSANIIDALASQPGISQVTTGSGISKPVIRGLGYNRVVTVCNGIRQEGQQWGDEHGIEIDEFAVNRVEILKGPASLTYGSDAMAGVINMISAPTLPDGSITGEILAEYQTNNGLLAYSLNFSGNQKGFIWDIRYSNKMAHAYRNRYDGFVLNSGYKENSFSGMMGLNKRWGYSHLHLSIYNLTPGIVEGERDSLSGDFLKPTALNDTLEELTPALHHDYMSYKPMTPFQKIHHYKAVLENSFIVGNGNIKATFGFQQNQRQEYADVLSADNYGLFFLLNTLHYDLRYLMPEKKNFNLSFGINGMEQISQNKGSEFMIPDYNLFDIGIFVIAKKTLKKFDISGGLRFDLRDQHGKDLYLTGEGLQASATDSGAYQQFAAFHSTFTGVSGSIGASYQISKSFFTKLNLSRGYRAPNIAELSANGVHEGTVNYIIGIPTLRAENSLQIDYALGYQSKHITAEIDLFSNFINNYIFLRKLQGASGGDSLREGYSAFQYSSGNANLSGGELSIDIHPHPLDWLHIENSFSYVLATQNNQPDSTRYLPFTPGPKLSSLVKATAKKLGKVLANAYVGVGVDVFFRQDKFYAAFGTETATPGYTLLNCSIGSDFVIRHKTRFSLYISANNLTDVAYQSHLSRLKYAAVNEVTGRTGVFNMGRNISFRLLLPLDFTRKK